MPTPENKRVGRQQNFRLESDKRPFVIVYHDMLESDILDTAAQKLLVIYLKRYADSDYKCFPSLRKLAQDTKMSMSTIQRALKELEKKGIIKIEKRIRADGGQTSNVYTMFDYVDTWRQTSLQASKPPNSQNQLKTAEMIAYLQSKGYVVSSPQEYAKKEMPNSIAPTKVTMELDISKNQSDINNNTASQKRCQGQYDIDWVKKYFEYAILVHDRPDDQDIVDAIYDILTDKINTDIVEARKLLQLDVFDLIYVVDAYKTQQKQSEIKNPRAYITAMLHNAKVDNTLNLRKEFTKNNEF